MLKLLRELIMCWRFHQALRKGSYNKMTPDEYVEYMDKHHPNDKIWQMARAKSELAMRRTRGAKLNG